MNYIEEMLMLRLRVMIGWVIVAATLPVGAAYAADATPATPLQEVNKMIAPIPASGPAPSVPSQGPRLENRPARLSYTAQVAAPAPRHDDFRFDLAGPSGSASAPALSLTPVISPSRTGWHFSGRVGPMRWLTPLDGERSTIVRLGGRVPGQPSVPGSGRFSLALHYAF